MVEDSDNLYSRIVQSIDYSMAVADKGAKSKSPAWPRLARLRVVNQSVKGPLDIILIGVGSSPPELRLSVVTDFRQVGSRRMAQYDFRHVGRDVQR